MKPKKNPKNVRFYVTLLVVYAVVSSAMVLILADKVNELNRQVAQAQGVDHLEVGEVAPSFTGSAVDGEPATLLYGEDEKEKLVFILRTTCPYSRSVVNNWLRLAYRADKAGYQVLGIVTDGLEPARGLAEEFGIEFPLTTFPNEEIRDAFKPNRVPQTIVVSKTGTVRSIRVGAFGESYEAELADLIESR